MRYVWVSPYILEILRRRCTKRKQTLASMLLSVFGTRTQVFEDVEVEISPKLLSKTKKGQQKVPVWLWEQVRNKVKHVWPETNLYWEDTLRRYLVKPCLRRFVELLTVNVLRVSFSSIKE
jgi:hypothetical protein